MNNTTTTRLLLARHGQTEATLDGTFCGTTEVALTAIGRTQAQRLAERLQHEHIDVLYCSPQQRAIATATPIATRLGLEIQQREALREMNFGLWEGRRKHDIAQDYPNELALWERGSWRTRLPDGESQQEVIARATQCMTELLSAHEGKTVLVVAHRTVLRLLIGNMLDMALSASRSLALFTASLSELHVTGEQVELVTLNDTSHLSNI